MLIDAIGDKVHTCDEWCSDFIVINMKLQVVRLNCGNMSLKKKRILNIVLVVGDCLCLDRIVLIIYL